MTAAQPSIADVQPYDPATIEPRWQARWRDERAFEPREDLPRDRRWYVVVPPSRVDAPARLDDLRARIVADALARFRRQRGAAVLHPLAWQSFGAAVERSAGGADPRAFVGDAIARRRAELERLGLGYAWRRAYAASDPAHAAREQALLLELVEAGLVHRMTAPARWSTGLASVVDDDEVRGGRCASTGAEIVPRELPQWFLRLTKYADELRTADEPLRDWPISRQASWGNPIPFVYGEHSGAVPLRLPDLPVALPADHASPLARHPTWSVTAADGAPLTARTAHGHEPARRETDTIDPAFTASWCAARFACGDAPLERSRVDRWLPADLAVVPAHGGGWLMRARFLQRALCDLGYSAVREPFRQVLRVGAVHGGEDADVARLVTAYGADAVRLSLLSHAATERDLPWSEESARGWRRFLDGVWASVQADRDVLARSERYAGSGSDLSPQDAERVRIARAAIAPVVTSAVERGDCSGAIDRCGDLAALHEATASSPRVRRLVVETLLRLLAPFAPHIAAELWRTIGGAGDIGSAGSPDDAQESA